MNSAMVALTNDIGAEGQVMEALCQMPAVRECYMVYGVYDVLARVQASTDEELSRTISSIRDMPGVRSTLTLVICREHKK
jgi:DNA-binding Lrp family transcriptional regulator